MTTYIINFILCSGLLLAVYHFFLRNENMYKFNRFYLLFSLVFSLIVPLVTIEVYPAETTLITHVQPAIILDRATAVNPVTIINTPVQQSVIQAPAHNYLPDVFIALYSIIAFAMTVRFARNLYTIRRSVAKNVTLPINNASLVLVNDEVTPHSFLKYIFINKNEYESGRIEPEIICHEQTHIKQLHSLDVILVELLQAICWFNPLIPLYRRAVQLNHEFLADEAVINNYHNTPAYQYLLISKAGNFGGLYLTSQFNYSITKKRLIMMTKNTSAATAWVARLAIIPVIAITFLLFCNKIAAASTPVSKTELFKIPAIMKPNDTARKKKLPDPPRFRINYPSTKEGASAALLKEYAAIVSKYDHKYDRKATKPTLSPTDRTRLEDIFKQMNPKQQEEQKLTFTYFKKYKLVPPTQALLDSCNNKLYAITIDNKRVTLAEFEKRKPEEFSYFNIIKLRKVEYKWVNYHYELQLMTTGLFDSTNKDFESPRAMYEQNLPNGGKAMEFMN